MKKILWLMVVGFLLACGYLYAESVAWETDPTAAGGRRQGILINMPTGESLSVTGGAVSDTIFMDSMVVNASSGAETTKALTGVKQIKLKARTGIDVRLATGTGSDSALNYTIISAGETFNMTNLNGIAMTLKILGHTATDAGTLSITYTR